MGKISYSWCNSSLIFQGYLYYTKISSPTFTSCLITQVVLIDISHEFLFSCNHFSVALFQPNKITLHKVGTASIILIVYRKRLNFKKITSKFPWLIVIREHRQNVFVTLSADFGRQGCGVGFSESDEKENS